MLSRNVSIALGCAALLAALPEVGAQNRDSPLPPGLSRALQDALKGPVPNLSPTTAQVQDRLCERFLESTNLLENARDLGQLAAKRLLQGGTRSRDWLAKDAAFRNAAKHQPWVPLEVEERVGAEQHRTLSKDFEVLSEDNLEERDQAEFLKAKDIFTKLIAQLPADQPYRFKLALVTSRDQGSDDANAFAAPGGYIYLTRAAARRDAAVITMLLAHEIAHITKRHYTRWLQGQLVDSATEGDQLLGIISGNRADLDRVLKRIDMLGVRFTRFHIDQELEADACATRLAATQAHFDVQKGVKAFIALLANEGVVKKSARARKLEPFEKAHPSYEERAATLNRLAQHWRQQTLLGKNVLNPYPGVAAAQPALEAAATGATGSPSPSAETGPTGDTSAGPPSQSPGTPGAAEWGDTVKGGIKALRGLFGL